MSDKTISNLGSDFFTGNYENTSFNLIDSIAVMHSLVLEKDQKEIMKKIMASSGIHFLNTTELLNYYEVVVKTLEGQLNILSLEQFEDRIERWILCCWTEINLEKQKHE